MKNTLSLLCGVAGAAIIALMAIHSSTTQVMANNGAGNSAQAPTPQRQSAAQAGRTEKASEIIGMEVTNLQGQLLGTVENLMVDLATGRVVAVVMSSGGGFWGGEVLSAIPPIVLRQNPNQANLMLDLTPEALADLPHFTNTEWPDISQPDYVDGVYRAYNVPPYYVVAQTPTQIAHEKRIALDARNVVTMQREGDTIIRIRPASDAERQAVRELEAEIADAREANRKLELKLVRDQTR